MLNRIRNYPILLPLAALSAGIVCAGKVKFPTEILWLSALLFFIFLLYKPLHRLCGLWILAALFLYGADGNTPTTPDPASNTVYRLKLRCEEILPQGTILNSEGNRFYLPDGKEATNWQTGDILLVTGRIFPVRETGNEGSFNYNRYLRQKRAYYRIAPTAMPEKCGHSENLTTFFEKLRQYMVAKTERLLPDSTHNALIKALCLGYKNDLDHQTRDLFTETGTVHLLAVSGLHTGAVFLLLSFFFRSIRLRSAGSQCLTLPLLWGYALLTGLSPSVIRAAAILTFIVIGKAFSRQYSSLNAIAAAAFLTLLTDPSALYSISMQMSYAAYTGIVLFYPLFQQTGKKLPAWLRGGYSLLAVTLSAQLSTLPLSIYYFHTVNTNSFLFNLPAVPLTTLLLYISVTALSLPFFVGRYLIVLSDLLCRFLLEMLSLFRNLSFNLHDLSLTPLHVLFIYALLLLLPGLTGKQRNRCLGGLCIVLFLFTGYCCLHTRRISSENSFVVFHAYRQSHVLIRCNGYYHLPFSPDNVPSYHTAGYIRKYDLEPMPETDGFSDETCAFTGHHFVTPDQHIALLTPAQTDPGKARSWVVTGNLLPRQLPASGIQTPKTVVLDGSNAPFARKEWEKFCHEKHILLLKTEEQGSITVK